MSMSELLVALPVWAVLVLLATSGAAGALIVRALQVWLKRRPR